jgi:hypothetical protein
MIQALSGKFKERFLLVAFLAYGFFYGAALFFILVLPITLFLNFYSGETLSQFMIGTALFSTLSGFLYGRVQKKMSFKIAILCQCTIVVSLMAVIAFLGNFVSLQLAAMLFVLSMDTNSSFNYIGLSNTINSVLSLDFSKKYYGYISGMISFGKICSIVFFPTLLRLIGGSFTLILVLLIQLCVVSVNLFIVTIFSQKKQEKIAQKKLETTFFQFLKNPLVVCVLIGYFLTYTVFNLWSLSYYDVVGRTFNGSVEIAEFISFFNLLQVCLEFILGALVLTPILRIFGLSTSLSLNVLAPLFAALVCVVLTPFLPTGSLFIGGLIPGALVYMAASNIFFLNISNLTLSPMKEGVRSWTNTKANLLFSPLGIAAGGGIFSLFYKFFGFSYIVILGALLLFALVSCILYKYWERSYLKELEEALNKQTIQTPDISFGPADRSIILQKFKNGSCQERLFLTQLTCGGSQKVFVGLIRELLVSNQSIEVEGALSMIREHKLKEFSDEIRKLPISKPLLDCLKVVDFKFFRDRVLKIFQDEKHPFFVYALSEGLMLEENKNVFSFWEKIKTKKPSLALRVLPESLKHEKLAWILKCLESHDLEVQKSAFQALPMKDLGEYCDTIFSMVKNPLYKDLFLLALYRSNRNAEIFLQFIENNPKHLQNPLIRDLLISFLGANLNNRSYSYLVDLLSKVEVSAQCAILKYLSLYTDRTVAKKELPEKTSIFLLQSLGSYGKKLSRLEKSSLVEFEKRQVLLSLATVLDLTYRSNEFLIKIRTLLDCDQYTRGYVLEWLSYKLKEKEYVLIETILKKDSKKVLDSTILTDPMSTSVVKSYVLYLLGKEKSKELATGIENIKTLDELLVQETVQWALPLLKT